MTARENPNLPHSKEGLSPRRRLAMRTAAVLVAVLGLLVLTGWSLSLPLLQTFGVSLVPMLPMTAATLVCAAAAVFLASLDGARPRRLALSLAGWMLLVGALSFGEYLFGYDSPLRHLLFSTRPGGPLEWPITMSQVAALCFLLIGTAMLCGHSRRRFAGRVVVICATVGLLVSLASLLGYLFGDGMLLGGGQLQIVSPHAALCFFLLFSAALVWRADAGWPSVLVGDTVAAAWSRQLLLVVTLVPVACAWLTQEGFQRGYYDLALGLALLTLSSILLLCLLVLLSARRAARFERGLQEGEERLRLATDAASIGVWTWNVLEDRFHLSPRCAWMLGLEVVGEPPAQASSEVVRTAMFGDQQQPAWARLEAVLQRRGLFRAEFPSRRGDGKSRWIRLIGRGEYDPDGRATEVVGVLIDITAERRAAETLREADRQKDEFLAMLGHELRNPLAPISSAASVLQQHAAGNPQLVQVSDIIGRQVRQMSRLVDDLLDVSRITLGRVVVRREAVTLASVIELALESAAPGVRAADHQLVVGRPLPDVTIVADLSRLSQALLNLLLNAIRYTPPGGRIDVTACCDDGHATISVRDSGIGIGADDIARAFEMFTRIDPNDGTASGGLGVGLALARALVEQHGGRLDAHSEGRGRGSCFSISLPLAADAGNRSEAVFEPAAVPAGPDGEGPRVLLVDDNGDALAALALCLELEGCEVLTAGDGHAALEVAQSSQPEVVVLDIGLPGLSGYEVARLLRSRMGERCPRLIALTGWGQDADKEKARSAGFDHHFTKPVEPAVLLRAIAPGS